MKSKNRKHSILEYTLGSLIPKLLLAHIHLRRGVTLYYLISKNQTLGFFEFDVAVNKLSNTTK